MLVFLLHWQNRLTLLVDVDPNFGVGHYIIDFVIGAQLEVTGVLNADLVVLGQLVLGLQLLEYFLLEFCNSFGREHELVLVEEGVVGAIELDHERFSFVGHSEYTNDIQPRYYILHC